METITGYVKDIIYQNEENGYTVLRLVADGEEKTCVGRLTGVGSGDMLSLSGTFAEHPVYGSQLKVEQFRVTLPDDAVSMERYLASGAIKGIGASLAAAIVRQFGNDTFRIMEEECERLAEVRGISLKKARDMGLQMQEKREARDAVVFLQRYGVHGQTAVRLMKHYGEEIYAVFRENPYRMAEEVEGIGFRTADEIALKAGISVSGEYRVRAGLLYALADAAQDGHVFLPESWLYGRTLRLLGLRKEAPEDTVPDPFAEEPEPDSTALRELFAEQLRTLYMEGKVMCQPLPPSVRADAAGRSFLAADQPEQGVYADRLYYQEQACAVMLDRLDGALQERMSPGQEDAIRLKIEAIEQEQGIVLDDLQRSAVTESVRSGVAILTGGPGTGKTTTINTILALYGELGGTVLLAAPTGRAAKRMREATGCDARTIHRMLEVNGVPQDGSGSAQIRFERNENNPLEADLIVIDEMSMVDLPLFYALLKAVSPGTRLLLVGDDAQLPSVGPGQVLHDLIASGMFPVITLNRIFRQAEESRIVTNAHRIHEGKMPVLDDRERDFFFLARKEARPIYKHLVQLIRDKLPPFLQVTQDEIQVLTPMKKGALGAETLNRMLQSVLNPEAEGKREVLSGDRIFREGDKVMQIRNNYQLEWEIKGRYGIVTGEGSGVFNGDLGRILEISPLTQTMKVLFDENREVRYPFALAEDLELAFAITIHKSQGSEYAAVLLPLIGGPRMLLNRNLLYTAVTRAKKMVVILGREETIRQMTENAEQMKRFSMLDVQIRGIRDV